MAALEALCLVLHHYYQPCFRYAIPHVMYGKGIERRLNDFLWHLASGPFPCAWPMVKCHLQVAVSDAYGLWSLCQLKISSLRLRQACQISLPLCPWTSLPALPTIQTWERWRRDINTLNTHPLFPYDLEDFMQSCCNRMLELQSEFLEWYIPSIQVRYADFQVEMHNLTWRRR